MDKPILNFVFSVDDGDSRDMRIADMLLKHSIPGIFYIPSNGTISNGDIKRLDESGFLIGGHTVSHPVDLKVFDFETQHQEIKGNKNMLEDLLGHEIEHFAYPRGRYNEETIEAVKLSGFKTARTTIVNKLGYENPYRMPTAFHVFPRKEYNGSKWNNFARSLAIQAFREDKICHGWCHSIEIEKHFFDRELSDFFKWLNEKFTLTSQII